MAMASSSSMAAPAPTSAWPAMKPGAVGVAADTIQPTMAMMTPTINVDLRPNTSVKAPTNGAMAPNAMIGEDNSQNDSSDASSCSAIVVASVRYKRGWICDAQRAMEHASTVMRNDQSDYIAHST